MFRKFTAVLMILIMFSTCVSARTDEKSVEYEYMDKLFGYAAELYIDEELTKEDILKGAVEKYLMDNPEAMSEIIKAGFSQIDEYTEYYSGDEFRDYVNSLNHTFYGIGVIIQKDGEYVQIVTVLEDGSAYEEGILEGDLISRVDGKDMRGLSIDAVQNAVTGEIGTAVSITVLRNGQEYTYECVRRPVNDSTVNYVMLDDKIAYVSVINFAAKTAEEFGKMLSELDEKGVAQIILDLRNNPGGYLISAVEIAEMTVPEGIIVQTMYRQSENNETYYSELKNPKYKFAVLVNENTASAAEILTGAMQDSGVGMVIGETTFGKGVIQDMYNMKSFDAFKITTGRYLTRNGREINQKGIKPDIEAVNTTERIDVSKYPLIDYKSAASIGDKAENVSVIKERLSVLGYYMSNMDNAFDSELEAAVLDFQITNGLEATGALDRITMVQIENAFAKSEVLVDNQLYTAYEYFGGDRDSLKKFLDGESQ